MRDLLSDPLPLRDTRVWPGYDEVKVIPRIYGRARITPHRYNAPANRYVLADHALAGVDAVTVGGKAIAGWRWYNGADITGHACAFLELSQPPASGATLAAEVRGLSGNPADILADLYPREDLHEFASGCRNRGIELGGAITERMAIRAAIGFVCRQAGVVWSAGLPGFVAPFPPAATDPTAAEFTALQMGDWSADCALGSLITRLSVPFDWDDADKKARQSLVLDAPSARRLHGERAGELALPWVRDARYALDAARAYLQWHARPLWTVRFTSDLPRYRLQPAAWVMLQHPRLPQSGRYVLTDLDPGYGSGKISVTAQAPAGAAPTVVLVSQAQAFET